MPIIVLPGKTGSVTIVNGTGFSITSPVSRSRSGSLNLVTSVTYNPGGNNAFEVRKCVISGAITKGEYGTGPVARAIHADYPSGLYLHTGEGVSVSVPSGLATQLFRVTNPYRANILLPAFLAELRELPSLIEELGRMKLRLHSRNSAARDVAKSWVGTNFGWAPLIGDLHRMLSFAESVKKRENEFDRLYAGSGLKRTAVLYAGQGTPNSLFFTAGSAPYPHTSQVASCVPEVKVWGYVTYRPAKTAAGAPVRRPTPSGVRKILSGLSSDGMTQSAWELIPWSWFIDYFYDVGSFLAANAGKRFLTIERAGICEHHKAIYRSPAKGATDSFGRTTTTTEGENRKETLRRTPVQPPSLPQAHLPFLGAGQLSILGSLVFLRSNGLRR